MCEKLRFCTHNAMGKCFGTWARILVRREKCVLVVFILVYAAISKYKQSPNSTIAGLNLLNFAAFPDQKAIWAPAVSNKPSK